MNKKIASFVTSVFLLSGCAGPVTAPPLGTSEEVWQESRLQQEAVYKSIMEDEDRLYDVAFPMMAANASFCGEKAGPALGVTYWNMPSVRESYRAAAASLYNLHDQLAVQHIAHDAPAYRAGIRSGDLIVSINGQKIEPGNNARKRALDILRRAGYDPVDFALDRAGKTWRVSVTPIKACNYGLAYNYGDSSVNAMSDGKNIVFSRGIMRFAKTDNELALVIGHEMAHNAMGHVDKQMQNALMGGVGGLLIDTLLLSAGVNSGSEFSRAGQSIGVSAHSIAFEQEADYVGMYFMERAGISSAHVADFWRRWAAEDPQLINNRSTHPTSPERFIAINRAREEIVQKKSAHQPLVPAFKEER